MRQIRTSDLFILHLYHNNSNHLQFSELFYLLNCHNHSYSLQSVTYLYLCHNDVNCLRFRGLGLIYLQVGLKSKSSRFLQDFKMKITIPYHLSIKYMSLHHGHKTYLLAKQQLNILPNIISFFIPTSKHLRRRQWGQKRRVRTSIRQSFWKRHFGCWKKFTFFLMWKYL